MSSRLKAHTRLLESVPANRSVSVNAPDRLRLVFAEAVDPRTVWLDVVAADGSAVPTPELLTRGAGDVEVVKFALPVLRDGVYGLAWVTVGPDGHRVAGEVIVGAGPLDGGVVAEASFQAAPLLDHFLSVVAVSFPPNRGGMLLGERKSHARNETSL